mmetsp:Transcript_27750/g.70737  ORF Transcript_27750/g.70737 Transcript_27750/m.70737 type:complete len:239 (+) Transcript_27750:191-907(+)
MLAPLQLLHTPARLPAQSHALHPPPHSCDTAGHTLLVFMSLLRHCLTWPVHASWLLQHVLLHLLRKLVAQGRALGLHLVTARCGTTLALGRATLLRLVRCHLRLALRVLLRHQLHLGLGQPRLRRRVVAPLPLRLLGGQQVLLRVGRRHRGLAQRRHVAHAALALVAQRAVAHAGVLGKGAGGAAHDEGVGGGHVTRLAPGLVGQVQRLGHKPLPGCGCPARLRHAVPDVQGLRHKAA